MKILPLFTLLIASISISAQTSLLPHNFDEGGYALVALRSEIEDSITNRLKEFFVKDVSVLKEMQKTLVYDKPQYAPNNGYNYEVYITKNGKILSSFLINLSSNYAENNSEPFQFDSKKFLQFEKSFSPIIKRKQTLTSYKAVLDKYNELSRDPSVIMLVNSGWKDFEGRFQFTYSCAGKNKDCMTQSESILNELTEEMKTKFPGENFELGDVGGSRQELNVEVMCNKSLEQKFNLYSRDLSEGSYDLWDQFKFEVTWYTKP